MNRITVTEKGKTYTRIDRRVAKRRYYSNKPVLLVPCKCHPLSSMASAPTTLKSCEGATFERLENAFIYYNCGYSETGRRVAFYAVD